MFRGLLLFIAGSLWAADKLLIPIDPQQFRQLSETVALAAQDGDNAAVLRNGRRALELAPNDPDVQAPIYLLMSVAAGHTDDAARSADYASIARKLDPSLDSRLTLPGKKDASRGDPTPTINTAVNVFGQVMGSIQQIRLMKMCLDMVKHGMAAPPACSAPAPGQPMGQSNFTGQNMPGQQMPPQPMPMPVPQPMPQQAGANVAYPPAPIGSAEYQPPLSPPAPMPGWPSQPDPSQPQPMPISQPMAMSQPMPAPQAIPMPQPMPSQAMPQQTGYSPQPPAYPQQTPPPQNSYPRQVPRNSYGNRGGYAYAPPAAPAPYANRQYRPGPRTRGGEEPVFRVIHDHSNVGDQTYFEQSCGALLSISGTNLTLTGSGGEAPSVIPASEILDIRVNVLVGKDAGVFHIVTRQGLYLSLAPESQDREQARSWIETIRTRLNLSE